MALLEERLGTERESVEDAIGCELISRMTTEELKEYTDALKRLRDSGELAEVDAPIWYRRAQLYEEVSREFAGAQA